MISVVLVTRDSAAILAQTLAALVPAAVDGLVKEVIVVDAGSTDATLEIAEDSGARIISLDGDVGTRLAAGCAAARGLWILALRPEALLSERWRGPVEAHLSHGGGQAAWLGEAGWLRGWRGAPWGVLGRSTDYDLSAGFSAGERPIKGVIRALRARRIEV